MHTQPQPYNFNFPFYCSLQSYEDLGLFCYHGERYGFNIIFPGI